MKAKLTKPAPKMPVKKTPEAAPVWKPLDIDQAFPVSPFKMMRRFTDDFERIFDNFNAFNMMWPQFDAEMMDPMRADLEKAEWWPVIEVAEKNGELRVHADLPGIKKEDINVEFLEDALVLSGERKMETEEEKDGFFHTERNYGSFYRVIPMPAGFDPDKAHAEFHNGVLEVTVAIPKPEVKSRKLEVADKAAKSHAKAA